MTKFLPFVYDRSGVMTNQKCFIITGTHLEYLTAFFNSSLLNSVLQIDSLNCKERQEN